MATVPLAAVIPFTVKPIRLNAQPDLRAMTDTPLALDLPSDLALPAWLAMGRSLNLTRRRIDWAIGDWAAHGHANFPAEAEGAIAELFPDARELRRVEKVAKTFPPHLRNEALTFEHHAKVADLPVQEALPLLKRASAEKLTPAQLRIQAYLHKLDTGQLLAREDDPEDDALLAFFRLWNRLPMDVRPDAAEMIADAAVESFRDIEP